MPKSSVREMGYLEKKSGSLRYFPNQEFISAQPKRFDEHLSEGGSNLSGEPKTTVIDCPGNRRKPDIYIFDDSFSALDYKTDATSRAAQKGGKRQSSLLAQRVSTIRNITDKIIVVMNEGEEVVGQGTHKGLLQNCEIYYDIASSQMSKEELA